MATAGAGVERSTRSGSTRVFAVDATSEFVAGGDDVTGADGAGSTCLGAGAAGLAAGLCGAGAGAADRSGASADSLFAGASLDGCGGAA